MTTGGDVVRAAGGLVVRAGPGGDSEIALNSTYMPKGTVNGNAVRQIAVVGKPGQLP